jgi:DNA-binding response OmpR family regulator
VSPEARTAAHRILVVEDDPQMVGLLASGLRRAGFVVDTMTDGADVTRQVSRQEYSAGL